MKLFLRKIAVFVLIIYFVNILMGKFLALDFNKKAEQKCFYPPLRWKEFYLTKENSLDIIFLGSSHSYRAYNPAIIDSITSHQSFNLASSIQTVSTAYYILLETLNYQNPNIVFLDVFPFTITHKQLEAVSYNIPYIKSTEIKLKIFLHGLSFKEKIEYLIPMYRNRQSFPSSLRFLFFPNYQFSTDEKYVLNGYVTSYGHLDSLKANEKNFWSKSAMTDVHMKHLELISEVCAENNICLILTRTPTATKVYDNLDAFDHIMEEFTKNNDLLYLKFDEFSKRNLSLKDFKDVGHLNNEGSAKLSKYLGNYILNNLNLCLK